MTVAVPNDAVRHHLSLILNSEELVVHLFKNDHEPSAADTTGDYEEADFKGYEPQSLEFDKWNMSGGNPVFANHEVRTFTSNARQKQKVYGYYVTGKESDRLYWAERFVENEEDAPFEVQYRRDTIEIEPIFRHGFGVK